jgi:D-glycero-D-manno-heptose 1,7-bisphosphate phosphatase
VLPPGVRLVIFDADNTLRRTTAAGKPCPHGLDEWELLPGVRETLARLDWAGGVRLGVASNQDQVAYGHLTLAMARRLLRDMVSAATGRAPVDACIQLCPHALEVPCDCRKPAPGMLLRIMADVGASPAETLFVGDAATDAEAARRAGVAFTWAADFFGWGADSRECTQMDDESRGSTRVEQLPGAAADQRGSV